ncbi:MAG: HAD family phosphatase [Phycisphaerales bacterium]
MSQHQRPFEAVLFDLDGVIIDTTALNYRVWTEFARKFGRVPTQVDLLATNGRCAADNIRNLVGDAVALDDDQIATLTVEREQFYRTLLAVEPVEAVAGVHNFVARLKSAGVPIAIATSAVPENAELALSRIGLAGAFPRIVTARDVREGKPAPECYLAAAAALGVRPDRCVVIEDAPAGIAAGKAAGAKVLALTTTLPRETLAALSPNWLAADFNDLPREFLV